jgi:hypothetical protein
VPQHGGNFTSGQRPESMAFPVHATSQHEVNEHVGQKGPCANYWFSDKAPKVRAGQVGGALLGRDADGEGGTVAWPGASLCLGSLAGSPDSKSVFSLLR